MIPPEDWVDSMLLELAASGVAFEHPALDYVEIQVNRKTWEELQGWFKERQGA